MTKNVILYPRVSWSKQSKYGESLEHQEEECRTYCKRNDYQVLAVFKEQFTWTKDIRPKLQEALEFIKNSELKIDHIIVYKVDRVSRWGIVIHESFKEQFKALWVTLKDTFWVISEEKNALDIKWIDTNEYNWAKDTTTKLTENVTVMMSENERNTILQRMLWQSMRNAIRGYKHWNADYWFKNDKFVTSFWRKTIQVDNPDESIFIKKMYELKQRWNLSDQEITDEINVMGYKSRVKKKWNSNKTEVIGYIWWISLDPEQFRNYIKNPIYAWIVYWKWTGKKAIKAPYDWLVSIKLWNEANRWKYKIIKHKDETFGIEYFDWENKIEVPIIKRPKNYNPEYPFWKVLLCPECGWHLTAERSLSKSGKYHHYYSCRGKKGVKHKNYSLKRDITNSEIVDRFTKLKFNNQSIKLFNQISTEVYKERKVEDFEKGKLILTQIKNLEIEKKSIVGNIQNIIQYPDLIEAQNIKLQKIKEKIEILHKEKIEVWESLWLEQFKKYSKKILTHLDKLVLQRDDPVLIELIFDIILEWKVEYEKLKSHTPILQEFLALNTKKEFHKNWNSSLNPKWWVTDWNYHTLKPFIVNMMNKVQKWQNTIKNVKF